MPSVFHRISQTPDQGQQNGTLMHYLARILISLSRSKTVIQFCVKPVHRTMVDEHFQITDYWKLHFASQ